MRTFGNSLREKTYNHALKSSPAGWVEARNPTCRTVIRDKLPDNQWLNSMKNKTEVQLFIVASRIGFYEVK